MTATRKTEKYSTLSSAYRFEPIAVENLSVFNSTTLYFISKLGRKICVHTGDARETSYCTYSNAFLSYYNGESTYTSTVWPTLGSRMAKEQYRTVVDAESVVELIGQCMHDLIVEQVTSECL